MISIDNKSECCGCSSCVQVCPKRCISLIKDDEGFFYPSIDIDNCINCGKCEKSCPILNVNKECTPQQVLASVNCDNDIRKQSSSGGVFTALAESVLNENGVVFGARFNEDWLVSHDYIESRENLKLLRGSKYLQSSIGNCYKKVKDFLDSGRSVLFSGTPCQVAGLKCFLSQKENKNLYLIDFVCHGVPSGKVWSKYIDEIATNRKSNITDINFRSKSTGWKSFSLEIKTGDRILLSEPFSKNIYMRAFLDNLILRPSCYDCKFRSGKSGSDITVADYWGINEVKPDFSDDNGCSLVLINTNKGKQLFDTCKKLYSIETTFDDACKHNRAIIASWTANEKRSVFFHSLDNGKSIVSLIKNCLPPVNSLLVRIINKLMRLIKCKNLLKQ